MGGLDDLAYARQPAAMRRFMPVLILAAAVAAIAWVASNDKPPKEQLRYGDVVRAECARQAGTDLDSQQACVTGKLLRKAMEMRAAER